MFARGLLDIFSFFLEIYIAATHWSYLTLQNHPIQPMVATMAMVLAGRLIAMVMVKEVRG